MKIRILLCLLFLAGVHFSSAQAEDSEQLIYVVVDLMKIKPGMHADYIKLEEAWKKIHQKRIDQGEMLLWGVYSVITNVGSDYDYNYAAVNFYRGQKQFAGHYGDGQLSDYADVLSKDEMDLVSRTIEIRELVREEVSLLVHQNKNGVVFPEVQWIQSLKLTEGNSLDDFLKIEKQLGGQVDNALIKDGALLNTQIYSRLMPTGSHTDFNLFRVFAFSNLEQMLAFPARNTVMMQKLNPGYAGLGSKFGTVSNYKSEAWKKIMCTCDE